MPELHVYRGETYYFKVFTVGNKCRLQYECFIFYRVPQKSGESSEDFQIIYNLTNIFFVSILIVTLHFKPNKPKVLRFSKWEL